MSGSASAGASSSLRELLRPPPHRGPLIAAGAVLESVRHDRIAEVIESTTVSGLFEQLDEFREKRFARPPILNKMLAAGWYGRKSGMGFYDYSGDTPVPNPQL